MDKTLHTDKKRLSEKVEKALVNVTYAESGELYSERYNESQRKKGKKDVPVCIDGETKSGYCV